MAKFKITLEYDDESTGFVAISGPTDHPTVMLKMLASAVSQVAVLVSPPAVKNVDAPREQSRIVVPHLALGGGKPRRS